MTKKVIDFEVKMECTPAAKMLTTPMQQTSTHMDVAKTVANEKTGP